MSGTYRALSDEAPPLIYATGGQPSRMVLLVPSGPPVPTPVLGRRVLTWHLAGMRAELRGSSVKAGISSEDYDVQWNALAHYAESVAAAEGHAEGSAEAGLVRIQELDGSVVEVQAGLHGQTVLSLRLKKYPPHSWAYQNASYECRDGGLSIVSYFLPPSVENPAGLPEAYSEATFYRAVDGSLVMLEQSPTGITNQYTSPFQKWWRWPGSGESTIPGVSAQGREP